MAKVKTTTQMSAPPMDVRSIPISEIEIGDQMIRRPNEDETIEELALDIATNGLLQPIGVRLKPQDGYQLLWGSRRLRAHQHLHLQSIPAAIYAHDDQTIRGIAVRENILRRQLSLEEECDAVLQLHSTDNLSPDQIARQVGKSRAWVLRRLAVHSLPVDLRTLLLDERLSLSAAETLAQIEDPSMRRYVTSQTLQSGWTTSEIKHVVSTVAAAPTIPEAMAAAAEHQTSPQPETQYLVQCACCGRARPLSELAIIRVCGDSCLRALQDPDGVTQHERISHA